MEVPAWYCPFKLDTSTISPFQPLIFLAGLDITGNQVHRAIWDTLNTNQTSKDFQPTYVTVPLDHRFPTKHLKAENTDGVIPTPKGILRSNWTSKHTQEIPSVIVAFFDMNWSDPQWNDRKLELVKAVKDLKTHLTPHGAQVLVMLVRPVGVVDENFSTERASSLCAAADIPPKCLFVLSHSHMERVQACIQRLEMGMRELAKNYYNARIKKIKSWKDKASQTPLLVRYNFKIGFFQEIRKDYITALSHYQAAFDALLSIKATDANVQELKVVASIVTYRICRIHLVKSDAKESINHFSKHLRSYYNLAGNAALMFEHLAWIENQYHMYGELAKQYRVASNFPDPVMYFLLASTYSEKRKVFFQNILKTAALHWPPEMEQFKGNVPVHFVGQRPWRADGFGLDNLYTVEDPKAIIALQYLESLIKHSELIIFHLGIGSDFCQKLHRGRTRCQLMSLMGREFLRAKEYSKCIMLMTHVLREIGNGNWRPIIYEITDQGMKAASCDGDIPAYCNFLVTLLKLDLNEFVSKERRQLLWSKFQSVINGKQPIPEEGYEMRTSRWEANFAVPCTSYVEVHREPILDCQVYSVNEVIHIGSSIQVKFVMTNRSEFPLNIRKCGIRTNIVDHKCEMDVSVNLSAGQTEELELSFKPLSRDMAKIVQIQVGYVDIGRDKRSVHLHYALTGPYTPYLWDKEWKPDSRFNLVKVEPTQPQLEVTITHDPNVLRNEWHRVSIIWENKDSAIFNKLSLGCQLIVTDPPKATLTANPDLRSDLGHLTHAYEIAQLAPGATSDTCLFMKCTNPAEAEVKLLVKGRYFDGHNQPMIVEHTETFHVTTPFEVRQSITNMQMTRCDTVAVDEQFLLHSVVANTSSVAIQFTNWNLLQTSSNYRIYEISDQLFQNGPIILKPTEEASFTTFVTALNSADAHIGTFQVHWKRDEPDSNKTVTEVSVIPFAFVDSPLFLKAEFSPTGVGKLKQPMTAHYTLFNRTARVHDVIVSMDSSAESFMNAGPKKITLKLNGQDCAEFSYILFPLRTGQLRAPKLIIETAPNGSTILEPVLLKVHQDASNTIFVTP